MGLNYLSEDKKNIILKILKSYYVDNVSHLKDLSFFIDSKSKIYIADYNLLNYAKKLKVMNLGLYFGKFHKEKFRLSQEGCNIVKPVKNYLILKKEALNSFLYGEDLLEEDFDNPNQVDKSIFLPVRYKDKYLGCVLFLNRSYKNFISKGRKVDFNKVI